MQAVPVSVEQLVGQTFGDFSVDQLLAQGSLSAVYLAHQSTPKRRALLTAFLLPAGWGEQQRSLFLSRFSEVASILVSLDHPHIIPTYSFGEQSGYPYLVTDFLEQVSLARVLKQQTRCTPMQTLALLKQIADALDYAHEHGMVHGTLKPANILLDDQQNVHITGLGLTHILEMRGIGMVQHPLPHLYSVADTLLYSPEYLAPEVVEGQPVDARSDMYALGCIVYELLCGKPPFAGDDPLEVAMQHVQQPVPSLHSVYAQAPAALDLIVQRTLDRDPDRRYKSAAKLANVFGRVLNVLDAAANPVVGRTPASLLDISERPTLPWFEADSSSIVQWSPQLLNTAGAVSIVSGLKSVMPPVVPWNAVRSAMETTATQQDNTAVMPATSQPAPENVPVQSPPSPEVKQAQIVASGALPQNVWPTSVPDFGQGLAIGTLHADGGAGKSDQKASSPVGRRKVLLFATGGVIATGLLAFGGLSLAHLLPSSTSQNHSATTSSAKNAGKNVHSKHIETPTPISARTPTPTPTAAATPTSAATVVPIAPTPAATMVATPAPTVIATPTSTATAKKKSKTTRHN
jgi:serine/threonine protein kinase